MKILFVFLTLIAVVTAAPDTNDSAFLTEWKRTRAALERAGFRVNHFADTPFAIAQEQREIRRQIEQGCHPHISQGKAHIGGTSPLHTAGSQSRIRKAPPIGKLGASRKLR